MADPTSDELYAIEVELEIRRRLAEKAEKDKPSVTKASPEFEAGSTIRQAIPDRFRGQVNSVANVLRQGPEFAALATDIGTIPFRAADKAFGLSDEPVFSLRNFNTLNKTGNVAFGEPNPIEKLIASIGMGSGTGLATKAIGPIRGALAGGAGYLGGEAGSTVGEAAGKAISTKLGTDPELTKALTTVGGGLIFGAVAGMPTILPGINTANRLAAEGLKGIPSGVRRALVGKQKEMADAGVFSMPSQLLEVQSPNLAALEKQTVASNVGSGALEERIRKILDQARLFARNKSRIPGEADDSVGRANEVQDVVERVIDLPRVRAREAARPFYEMLEKDRPQLSVEARFRIANKLADLDEQVGLLEKSMAGKALSKVEKTVDADSVILQAREGKVPFRLAEGDIYSLDNYISKELRTRIENLSKLSASSKEMVERAGLIPAYKAVRQELIDESSVLRAAKNAYQRTREAGLKEVRSTGIPNTRPLNVNPGPMTPSARWEQFKPILEQGNAEDVRRAAALVRGRDGKAFRDVAQKWLDDIFNSSFTPGSGNTSEPKAFAEKLLTHPNLDVILEEAVKGVKGVDPTEFAVSFRKALRILQSAGRPVSSGSSMDVTRVIGSDPAAMAGRYAIVHQLGRKAMLASKYFEWAQNRQWKKLYSVFDSADSMKKLSEMAEMAEMNPRTAAYLATIVGGSVSVD